MQSAHGESLKGACADAPGMASLLETAESGIQEEWRLSTANRCSPANQLHIDGSERKSVSSARPYQEVE